MLAAFVLIAAACGDSGGVFAGTTSTSVAPPASTSPQTSVTSTATSSTTATTLPPRLDFAAPTPSSYTYSVTLEGQTDTGSETVVFKTEIQGAFATPDSHQITRRESAGGNLISQATAVVIGDEAWVDGGDGFTPYNRNAAAVQAVVEDFTSLSELLPDAEFYDELRNTDVDYSLEELDTPTYHIVLTKDTPSLEELLGGPGSLQLDALDEFSFDIWMDAATGRILRFGAVFGGPSSAFDPDLAGTTRMRIEAAISDYADPTVVVERPVEGASAPPAGYKTFQDAEVGGFSIVYPRSWDLATDVPGPVEDGVSIAFQVTSPDDGDAASENVNMAVEFVDFPDLTLDQYSDISLNTVESLDGFELVSVEPYTTAKGFDARWVEFTADGAAGSTLYFVQLYMLESNIGYVLTYTALPETVDVYLQEFIRIADGFELLPA